MTGFRFWLLLIFCVVANQNAFSQGKAIYRICVSTNNDDIVLFWTHPPDTCAAFVKVEIFGRPDNFSPFVKIGEEANAAATQYIHAGAKAASPNWSYYLVYSFLCDNTMYTSDTSFIDYTQPKDITLDSVSIDVNTGEYVAGWTEGTDPDILGYVVWENDGANNTPVDTVDSAQLRLPGSGIARSFTLTVLDSCLNQSVIGTVHRTIFLTYTYDTCKKLIRLNWTPYVGWNVIGEYRVFYSLNGAGFQQAASGSFNSYDLLFTAPGQNFEIYIQAKHGTKNFTSSSNKVSLTTPGYRAPVNLYIETVTVDYPNFDGLTLQWINDPGAEVSYYKILQGDNAVFLRPILQVPYSPATTSVQISLAQHNLNDKIKYYQLVAYDKCDNILSNSNVVRNILLKVDKSETYNSLSWNTFIGWDAGVGSYEVYRGYNNGSGFTWNLMQIVSDSSYIDNELDITPGNEGICYYVKASEADGNQLNVRGTSLSNKICLIEDMLVYIPNAVFAKKGEVKFEIKGIYLDYSLCKFTVFNRWGETIYQTNDITKGWDGTSYGTDTPDGVYIYLLEAYSLNGKKEVFKGTITILR